MASYNSSFTETYEEVCGFPLLPIKCKPGAGGGAPIMVDNTKQDIIDEAIAFFRVNIFMKTYPVKSPADKVLIYLTLYIQKLLRTIAMNSEKGEMLKNVGKMMQEETVPADPANPKWVLSSFSTKPQTPSEVPKLNAYFKQLREETNNRFIYKLYDQYGPIDLKFWIAFRKMKFMGMSL